ncbi:MAG: hypothetical protein K0R98_80 [Rickettsiaceae bacterium]|jgi:SH3-like domain-containing protein|nr:hypothetical protein [Rickettsiaceae bacterium]
MNPLKLILIAITATLFCLSATAKTSPQLPYYATIKADKANLRTGPSVRYPISWIYMRPNWPVQITATFETWRKIEDINGEVGWIHESLLSGKRYVLIHTNGVQEIFRLPIPTSSVVVIAENGVVAELLSCKNSWCKIRVDDEKGWIEQKNLWGVKKDEAYN